MKVNDVVNNLFDLYREKKLSHAYLIETNNIDLCLLDVKILIKKMCCCSNYSENCTSCNLCHLIDNNLLPSVIIVRTEDKNIKKEAVENLKTMFNNAPFYTKNNIYVIIQPEKMNSKAYNKMLKFIEEPEENILGFFITNNKDYVANTIVSRCEIVKMYYDKTLEEENAKSDTSITLVHEYLDHIMKDDFFESLFINTLNKSLQERHDIIYFVKILYNIFFDKILNGENLEKNHKVIKILTKYLDQLNYNININLLLDSMTIELGEVYGK